MRGKNLPGATFLFDRRKYVLKRNMMNKRTFLLTFLFSVALMSTSCEKENTDTDNLNPDKHALRISKIADNAAMFDPWWAFEYNDDGLVTKITGDRANDTIYVTYNNDDLPVMIVIEEVRSVIDNHVVYDTILISWSQNSFTLYQDYYFENVIHTFDANGHITIINWSADEEYMGYEARWGGSEVYIYFMRGDTEEWAQTRELNEYSHPLSAINLAILVSCDISWIFDECEFTFQNKYCLKTNSSADEGSAVYEYEYNKDGYPTQLDMYETTEHANWMFYFEYEND